MCKSFFYFAWVVLVAPVFAESGDLKKLTNVRTEEYYIPGGERTPAALNPAIELVENPEGRESRSDDEGDLKVQPQINPPQRRFSQANEETPEGVVTED